MGTPCEAVVDGAGTTHQAHAVILAVTRLLGDTRDFERRHYTAIVAALELNAIKGKLWPAMATVRGVIHCSIGLAVVLWLIMSLL